MTNNSLNLIRLLRVVITPSVTLLRGENVSQQSDEIQANCTVPYYFIVLNAPNQTISTTEPERAFVSYQRISKLEVSPHNYCLWR